MDELKNKTTIFRHCLDSSQYLTKNNELIKREKYMKMSQIFIYTMI